MQFWVCTKKNLLWCRNGELLKSVEMKMTNLFYILCHAKKKLSVCCLAMELFNEEKGKLRKKDKDAFYYDRNKKFVKVPAMTEDKEIIYNFIKFCMEIKHPEIDEKEIQTLWTESENKMENIIAGLEQMKAEADATGADIWKSRSYAKAIAALQAINVPIISGTQAQKLTGIGKGIAGVIDEVLRHGRIKTQEERMEAAIEREAVTEKFLKIWDVTTKLANEWYYKGKRSIEDIKSDKTIKSSLKGNQILGLKYYEDLQNKIPSSLVQKVLEILNESGSSQHVEAVGNFRRQKYEDIDIIDILISSEKTGKTIIQKYIDILEENGCKIEVGHIDTKSVTGVILVPGSTSHVKFELTLVNPEDYGISLINKTGPDSFLKQIKEQAAVLGYRFDKKGLVKLSEVDDNDISIKGETEEDIFKELGMKNVPPNLRE